jgi:hypothetical protein
MIELLELNITIEHLWGENPKQRVSECPSIIDVMTKVNEIIEKVNELDEIK